MNKNFNDSLFVTVFIKLSIRVATELSSDMWLVYSDIHSHKNTV